MRLIDADALPIEDLGICRGVSEGNLDRAPTVEPTFRLFKEMLCTECDKRPQGECKTCRHHDPEDNKCDCGGQERQGCIFPVSDDYFCKFYEERSAECQ